MSGNKLQVGVSKKLNNCMKHGGEGVTAVTALTKCRQTSEKWGMG